MKMQILSMGEQCILYCLESAKCANNGIQGNNLCNFTVFRKLNVEYGRGHCVIFCPSGMSGNYVS